MLPEPFIHEFIRSADPISVPQALFQISEMRINILGKVGVGMDRVHGEGIGLPGARAVSHWVVKTALRNT